ncbi:MAG: ArsC/Spx/MgsR family protein [Pseudomonadota bacterium]
MTATIYGIKSCTTVRKARKWAEAEGLDHTYVEFAELGADIPAHIQRWFDKAGQDKVMNTRSTNFKALPEDERERMQNDADYAVQKLAEDPRMLKRPVLETERGVVTGFDVGEWEATNSGQSNNS